MKSHSEIKYCLPIVESDRATIREIISQYDLQYDYFEVWADYVEKMDKAFLDEIVSQLGGRLIVLFRRLNLEPVSLPSEVRLHLIEALSKGESLLDLDVTQADELEFSRKKGLLNRLILSYHNYQNTPSNEELRTLVSKMEKEGAAIIKLATLCETKDDALRLLELTHSLRERGRRVIILGMGEFGSVTRIFGSLWGNEMVFAPAERGKSTAPGQLTRQELEKVFKVLEQYAGK